MWPRLIAQLIELLPHVSRLVPVADNFFASKAASDKTHAAALAAMGESLRGDLGRVSEANADVTKQISEQATQITALRLSLEEARADSITQTRQIEWITKDINSLRVWIKFGVCTIVLLLIVILTLITKLLLAR